MISTKAFAILALFAAAPACAGPLVVRALGPSAAAFKPGQRLADAMPLVLKAGDQVTILDARGTRSFAGPGSFRIDSASTAATPSAFTELLTQKPVRRARIGAVRGLGSIDGKPVPPGIWLIDAGTSATFCALDPLRLALWRAEPLAAGTVTVVRASTGIARSVGFAAGQAVANWPAGLAAGDGDRFQVTGAGDPVTITIRRLETAPKTVDDLGEALLEADCTAQFERLVNFTATTDAMAPGAAGPTN